MQIPHSLQVRKEVIMKEDGRTVILYSFVAAAAAGEKEPLNRTLAQYEDSR
jgi:hypothetical protein